jgi:hypothetical protein
MCGLPLGIHLSLFLIFLSSRTLLSLPGVWQPLGLFDDRISHRKEVSSIVCEACFRQATAPLHSMATIVGDTGRCVVPNTLPRRPESFLALYYGHQASLNKYRGTTGQFVDLTRLSSEKLLSQVSEQNSFLRSEKKGMVSYSSLSPHTHFIFAPSPTPQSAVKGRSNKYANRKGEGDGTSRTTSTQSELEVSDGDDDSLLSDDISDSEAGSKGLQGVSLLEEKASNDDDGNRYFSLLPALLISL